MRLNLIIIVLFAFAAPSLGRPHSTEAASNLFLLKETEGDVVLEAVKIAEGETRVFSEPDVITFIIPFGTGQSGDVVQRSEGAKSCRVTTTGGELQVTVQRPDGTERALPTVKIGDLRNYLIRVNVTGANGVSKAFMIRDYEKFGVDDGPVIDMFRGMIPLQPGDYSITTEVKVAETLSPVYGAAPLQFSGGLLFTAGKLPDGTEADFIVDFGAGGTLVTKDFLPAGTAIQEVKAVEYSDEGERVLKGTMGGAGGDVSSFLGNAELPGLSFGEIAFSDVTVRVVDETMEFGGRKAAGILGLDLLRRAEVVSFGYDGEGNARLAFSPEAKPVADGVAAEIPFTMAVGHIFIESEIGGVPLSFLFDSGARGTIISEAISERAGLEPGGGTGREFRGMDGNPIPSTTARAAEFTLGGQAFTDIDLYVAELPVLQAMGLKEDGGLLGNDFLQRFSRIDVDFDRQVIRLWN
jgi:predicted aspartyl protease